MGSCIELQVPGSTSNLGPCFDAVGLAVDVLLCVRVYWKPVIDSIDGGDVGNNYEGEGKNHRDSDLAPDKVAVPLRFTGEGEEEEISNVVGENLMLCSALKACEYKNVRRKTCVSGFSSIAALDVHNAIPLGRGLGSSGAAVVAGVLLADAVFGLKMTIEDKVTVSTVMEGHPDNVTPSLLGGLVACVQATDNSSRYPSVQWVKIDLSDQIEVSTKRAREVLPESYSTREVIFNIQHVAVLIAALATGSISAIGEGMRDCVHQPQRAPLVPGLAEILSLSEEKVAGLLGICLSGAGPTIVALCREGTQSRVGTAIQEVFERHGITSKSVDIRKRNIGAQCNGYGEEASH